MARSKGRMGKIGDETYKRTDEELAEQELQLLQRTSIDWEKYRPNVNDDETYDRLIAIVNESTSRNENLAQLKERLQKLGSTGTKVAKKLISLLK